MKTMNRHFSRQCVVSIGLQMIDLLEQFHSLGYVHSDLKPDNVLVGNFWKDRNQMN